MKNICLCIKIHIPAVQLRYRFLDIHRDHRYYDDILVKKEVDKICDDSLQPFFEIVRDIFFESGGNFRAGISVSGVTLSLLQRLRPDILEELNILLESGCVEMLSEPWSRSIIPFVDKRSLLRQVQLHDSLMKSVFGKIPEVFFLQSPISLKQSLKTIIDTGKKSIITYADHVGNANSKHPGFYDTTVLPTGRIKLVDYKTSRLIHNVDYLSDLNALFGFISQLSNKMEQLPTNNETLIITYNPVKYNNPFGVKSIHWRNALLFMLGKPVLRFRLPSEMFSTSGNFDENTNGNINITARNFLPDVWLKNKMQTEAFKRQLSINTIVQLEKNNDLVKEWDILQDMEYLFYMSTFFKDNKYRTTHFSPFMSPTAAYLNYMLVLDDFMDRLNRKIHVSKNESFTKKRKELTNSADKMNG